MNPHQSCWPQSTGEIKHSSLPLLFFKHSSLLTHGVVLISEETKYLALSVTSYLWYRRKHISRWKARSGGPGSQKQLYTHGISHPKHQVKKWDAAVVGVVEDEIKWKMVCVALILFFQTGCMISTRPLQFFTIIVPASFFLIALQNTFIWGKIFLSFPFLSFYLNSVTKCSNGRPYAYFKALSHSPCCLFRIQEHYLPYPLLKYK